MIMVMIGRIRLWIIAASVVSLAALSAVSWLSYRNTKELIAANNSIEEIRKYVGADSLSYLSLDGLKKACHDGEKTTYCTACYTGRYPTNLVDVEEILPAIAEKP